MNLEYPFLVPLESDNLRFLDYNKTSDVYRDPADTHLLLHGGWLYIKKLAAQCQQFLQTAAEGKLVMGKGLFFDFH